MNVYISHDIVCQIKKCKSDDAKSKRQKSVDAELNNQKVEESKSVVAEFESREVEKL